MPGERAWSELENSGVPIFFVGTATCGRAAGAGETLESLRTTIQSADRRSGRSRSGCLGPCSLEPLSSSTSLAARVCYGNVGPREAGRILELVCSRDDDLRGVGALVWTPARPDGIGARFFDLPMIRRQVRRVLRNCGIIDPENIDHYLARDGYRGFVQASGRWAARR